jgi:dihydrodipicolinate synthase/N-acetylneuraminate lyase
MQFTDIPAAVLSRFRGGTVIPAHPLALTAARTFDPRRQRALTRYYLDAGAGGLAVGVHTTQFAIRQVGLLRPVLEMAAATAAERAGAPAMLVAGAVGPTAQAVDEARLARSLGYHAVLLSLAALREASEDELVAHCRTVAAEMPLIGFYLQPAVGGRPLPASFWERFAAIENVIGIKVAPFNRYATLDVLHGVARAGAADRVSLYTGNDDHIVLDLILPFRTEAGTLRFAGGLLGHWSVWTRGAVAILERCKAVRGAAAVPADLLALDSAVTDCNAAVFDAANGFAGVIAGCHEILRRQGLLAGRWCLDPAEDLGPGQMAAIDRICRLYPDLGDDAFVAENLDRWLAD